MLNTRYGNGKAGQKTPMDLKNIFKFSSVCLIWPALPLTYRVFNIEQKMLITWYVNSKYGKKKTDGF